MLKYVLVYHTQTDCTQSGFVLREDNDSFTLMDPICYEWILKKDKETWLAHLNPPCFDKKASPYTERILTPNWSFMKGDEWLFNYDVPESFLPNLDGIVDYMACFAGQNRGTMAQKISLSNALTIRSLSNEIQQDLSLFIRSYYQKNRLRFLVRGEIMD